MNCSKALACLAAVISLQTSVPLAFGGGFNHGHHQTKPVRFAVFSDPHFYDPALGTTGSAFEQYLAEDRKMLRESTAIIDAAVDSIIAARVDFVIVAGDLTKDGELINHLGMAHQLARLERAGIETFVVPGNHDIDNPHALAFTGDSARRVRNVSPREFAAIYFRSGFGEAIDRDRHSLSYVAEPVRGLWLLALDSAEYAENETLGRPVTAGRLSPETRAWARRKLAQAKASGKQVIGVLHHGMLEHFTAQSVLFSDYVLEDWQTVSKELAEAGLQTVFTGHFHAQDITSRTWQEGAKTLTLTDVETGSLVTSPSPYRIVTLARNGDMSIESRHVEAIDFDLGGTPFPQYAAGFLYQGLLGIATDQLVNDFGLTPGQASVLAPPIAAGFAAHYAGDEVPTPEVLHLIGLLQSDPASAQLGYYLQWVWTDLAPADNSTVIDR